MKSGGTVVRRLVDGWYDQGLQAPHARRSLSVLAVYCVLKFEKSKMIHAVPLQMACAPTAKAGLKLLVVGAL